MKENLFDTKQKIIGDLKKCEDELARLIKEAKDKETNIWLNTNFKDLGYTNEDTRNAYVDSHLSESKHFLLLKQNEIRQLKRELELVNDKIKLFS